MTDLTQLQLIKCVYTGNPVSDVRRTFTINFHANSCTARLCRLISEINNPLLISKDGTQKWCTRIKIVSPVGIVALWWTGVSINTFSFTLRYIVLKWLANYFVFIWLTITFYFWETTKKTGDILDIKNLCLKIN